ncbi:hypothetical protein [Amycolatopsis sp. cmx-4-68]|uniref:hypothetical protein n=1 Tax=Amycolatopsis sp. cmx-4-68 TaxID=2790938 RepID=UPI00397E4F98
MTGTGWPWPALDAAVARIDAALAEPDPQLLADARWLIAANPSLGRPMDPRRFARAAAGRHTDAIVAATLAHHAYSRLAEPSQAQDAAGWLVHLGAVDEPRYPQLTVPSARKYVAPPADTRPGWIGWLRRRLFGEPPQ